MSVSCIFVADGAKTGLQEDTGCRGWGMVMLGQPYLPTFVEYLPILCLQVGRCMVCCGQINWFQSSNRTHEKLSLHGFSGGSAYPRNLQFADCHTRVSRQASAIYSFFQFKRTHTPSLSLPLRNSIPIFFSIEISRSTVRGLTDNVSDIFLAVIVGDVLRIAIIFFWRSESSAVVISPTSCAVL